ncbi:MAG: hypothetical protein R3F07_06030 [Opitutaceae bacterium]
MSSTEKFKITLYLVAIFLVGCVAGGFAALALKRPPGPPNITNLTDRQMQRMTSELALSEEQAEAIRPIVAQISEEIRVVRRESMAQFARIYDEMVQRIEAELTPEQAALFRVREKERRERANSMMIRRHKDGMDRKGSGPGPRDGGWRRGEGTPPPEPPPLPEPPPEGP